MKLRCRQAMLDPIDRRSPALLQASSCLATVELARDLDRARPAIIARIAEGQAGKELAR